MLPTNVEAINVKVRGVRRPKIDASDFSQVYDRYAYIVTAVCNEYFDNYGKYVSIEDIAATADLKVVEMFTDGFFNSQHKPSTATALMRTLSHALRSYCAKEINSYKAVEVSKEFAIHTDVAWSMLRPRLSEVVSNLPGSTRRVIEMYYWEDMTTKDIAHALELTPARITQLRERGLRLLRNPRLSNKIRDLVEFLDM